MAHQGGHGPASESPPRPGWLGLKDTIQHDPRTKNGRLLFGGDPKRNPRLGHLSKGGRQRIGLHTSSKGNTGADTPASLPIQGGLRTLGAKTLHGSGWDAGNRSMKHITGLHPRFPQGLDDLRPGPGQAPDTIHALTSPGHPGTGDRGRASSARRGIHPQISGAMMDSQHMPSDGGYGPANLAANRTVRRDNGGLTGHSVSQHLQATEQLGTRFRQGGDDLPTLTRLAHGKVIHILIQPHPHPPIGQALQQLVQNGLSHVVCLTVTGNHPIGWLNALTDRAGESEEPARQIDLEGKEKGDDGVMASLGLSQEKHEIDVIIKLLKVPENGASDVTERSVGFVKHSAA
eukprot:11906265-Alexandrium_andersonii.AAC.1